MDHFELHSPYQPQGDQPQAIKELVSGILEGKHEQTLLGATGTGKTFTIANVIKEVNKPTLVLAHNKTLAGQLYGELKEFFTNNTTVSEMNQAEYERQILAILEKNTENMNNNELRFYMNEMVIHSLKQAMRDNNNSVKRIR